MYVLVNAFTEISSFTWFLKTLFDVLCPAGALSSGWLFISGNPALAQSLPAGRGPPHVLLATSPGPIMGTGWLFRVGNGLQMLTARVTKAGLSLSGARDFPEPCRGLCSGFKGAALMPPPARHGLLGLFWENARWTKLRIRCLLWICENLYLTDHLMLCAARGFVLWAWISETNLKQTNNDRIVMKSVH